MTSTPPRRPDRQTRTALTAGLVAALSVTSRVLALLVLVPAAHRLGAADFGTFSLALGLAIAAGNVIGSAPADLVATAAHTAPRRTRHRVTTAASAVVLVGVVLLATASVTPQPAAVAVLGCALASSSAVPVLAMSLLRGTGRPVTGAVLAFLVLPLARAVAVTVGPGDLVGLLGLLAVVGTVLGGLCVAVLLWTGRTAGVRTDRAAGVRTDRAAGIGTGSAAGAAPGGRRPDRAVVGGARRWLPAVAGTTVGLGWTVVGQAGLLALAATSGPGAVAAIVPTVRGTEALTAVAIGYKAAAQRSLHASVSGSFPPGTVRFLVVAVLGGATVLCATGPALVPLVFGPDLRFSWAVGPVLVASSLVATLVAVKVQLLVAARAYRRITLASVAGSAVAVPAAWVGASAAGATGVAVSMLLATTTWLVGLTAVRSHGRGGC